MDSFSKMEQIASLQLFDSEIAQYVFSPFDPNIVALSSVQNDFVIYDIKALKQLASLQFDSPPSQIKFADETHLVVLLISGVTKYIQHTPQGLSILKQFKDGHLVVVPSLATFCILATPHKYAAYDFQSGEKLVEVPNIPDISALQIHPDGIILATGHENGKVTIWDI